MADQIVPRSPFRRFPASQKVWYDQAVTRQGDE